MLSESPSITGPNRAAEPTHAAPASIAGETYAAAEALLQYGITSAELASWTPALQSVDPEIDPRSAVIAASRLQFLGIRPEELCELAAEYPRSGPGGAFVGFRPGAEAETAMQLHAIRAKLRDLERIHDSTHAD